MKRASMIDYTTVTREIRSLISRRRELLTFLGTVFAALSVFLQNALEGGLPPVLASFKLHLFACHALLLMVPSLLLALRLARLNTGMTLNGILYQRLMMEQNFTHKATQETLNRAGHVNPFGVSFLMFLLADVIAAFSVVLLGLALAGAPDVRQSWPWLANAAPAVSFAVGALVVVGWLGLYLYFHYRARAFALKKIAGETIQSFGREEWEAHTAGSLEDANHDMITVLALAGLIFFAAFEGLTALGKAPKADIGDAGDIIKYGPVAYSLLTTVTCLFGMTTYIRLRVAVGGRSLELDPTDQPFRPFRLTDSLLGLMLLAFLFAVSLHVLLESLQLGLSGTLLFIIATVAFVLAVTAEQLTLFTFGRPRRS